MSKRVERGIAFLDQHAEPGWRERIDLSRLDLGDHRCCVLGQHYGNYGRATEMGNLGLSYRDSYRCGFTLGPIISHSWARLTDEWKEALAEKEKGP